MNSERVAHIVGEVIARLQRRAQRSATLSVVQLRQAEPRSLFCQYASLRIEGADLPLLAELIAQTPSDVAAVKIHEALALGLQVRLILQQGLMQAIPVKQLARLPLRFRDVQGRCVTLHPKTLLSYADVARQHEGWLVLRRRCVVTALAREAASARNIQLIRQE